MPILCLAVGVSGCAGGAPAARSATTGGPAAPLTLVPGTDAVSLAAATSAAFFRSAPTVVLAADGDLPGQARAADAAARLGAPMLLVPGAPPAPGSVPGTDPTRAELVRAGARVVIMVGDAATRWAGSPGAAGSPAGSGSPAGAGPTAGSGSPAGAGPTGGSGPTPVALPADPGAATALLDRYRAGPTMPPVTGTLVLAHAAPEQLAAMTTARDAGARVVALPLPDPRSGADTQRLLTTPPPAHVVVLGSGFGPLPVLERRLATAVSAAQLPGGGQLMFPGRLMVALYGSPGTPALGTLGEQGIPESVAKARQLAVDYQPFSAAPVVPAFEIIATVAASSPGADGNYSGETDPAALRPWVDAAAAAGVYVVLDLQPGRTDFLTQAKLYADLLARPNVGLALDPEWRLAPGQVHRVQVGSVGADEINSVVAWLADLTRARGLPQKLLMLHQFRVATIADRARVDTGRDEVAVLVHADGFGTPPLKLATWNALRAAPLPGAFWGWKDFIDEDHPTFTPRQTLEVSPDIRFVSYQ